MRIEITLPCVLLSSVLIAACPSSHEDPICTPGAERCECVEGECLGDLACLSGVCVDPFPEDAGVDVGPDADVGTGPDIGPATEAGPEPDADTGPDADVGPDADTGPDVDTGPVDPGPGTPPGCDDEVRKLDILFVVDASRSMLQEQDKLRAQIPRALRVLASGDPNVGRPGEGRPEELFPGFDSIHAGVITVDMGVAGVREGLGDGCHDNSERGDDGRLLLTGDAALAGCRATYSRPWVDFDGSGGAAAVSAASDELACRVGVGPNGCGFEQQLEAMLKATTESTSPIRFFGETVGHACAADMMSCGAPNEGFFRDDAILAILVVSDENDCSIRPDSGRVFNPHAMEYNEDLNTRCFLHGTAPELSEEESALQPISRYVDGLAALKSNPSQLVISFIVGIPEDLVGRSTDEILSHPSMQERLIPNSSGSGRGQRVDKACVDALADNPADPASWATPGTRYVEVAEGLRRRGVTASVMSICAANYDRSLGAIIERAECGR